MAFEYVPGKSLFHRLDPRTKLFYYAAIVFLTFALDSDPIFLTALFCSVVLVIHVSNIPLNHVTSFLVSVMPVAIVYAFFNLLFPTTSSDLNTAYLLTYLIPPNGFPITLASLIWSIGAALRFLIILIVLRTVLMLTPIRDLVLSLVKLKMPPEFGMALSIGFAYVPVLTDENRKIKEAQQARGWTYEHRNPAKRFNALIRRMFIPAIFNSMRRTSDIALAIESKGFSHNIAGRTYLRELKFTNEDYLVAAILTVVMVLGIVVGPWGWKIADYLNTVEIVKSLFHLR
jgi:energy-coupling factor transport system permease protein